MITPDNVKCSFSEDCFRETLTYYEDGKLIGIFNCKGFEHFYCIPSETLSPIAQKHIKELESAPPDWVLEGYESLEDYYYDNEED